MKKNKWILIFLLLFQMGSSSQAQDIDLVQYLNIEKPLLYADFIGSASGESYIERWVYTENVSYNNTLATQIEQLRGTVIPDQSITKTFYKYNDTHLMVVGVMLSITLQDSVFPVELQLNPYIEIPRFISMNQKIERTGKSEVKIGIIKATIQFLVSYEWVAVEDMDTPLGHFEKAARLNSIKEISIPGLSESIKTTEWYMAQVGLIKLINNDSQSVIEITEIRKVGETAIANWECY